MRRTLLWIITPLLLAAALGAWLLVPRKAPATETPVAASTATSLSVAPLSTADDAEIPAVLPVYQADLAGLPPIDAPFRESYVVLAEAADRGNATAACRLAFIAMDCWTRPSTPLVSERRRDTGDAEVSVLHDSLLDGFAEQIEAAPPAFSDYVRGRVEGIALAGLADEAGAQASRRRCEGAALVGSNEVARRLRQAALAGQPDAVHAYVHGAWMETILGVNAARTPDRAPLPLELLRGDAFLEWRRDAPALHQAALAAGQLSALEAEAMPNRMTSLDQLVHRDRTQQAAALRALATLVSVERTSSTATLGLSPEQARRADALSEQWAAAARARGADADPYRLGRQSPMGRIGTPACD